MVAAVKSGVKVPAVYILASKRDGILYIGVTSDLFRRLAEHAQGLVEGFTKKHGVCMLVYYETLETMPAAIAREKQLKHWNRAWKIRLIKSFNPNGAIYSIWRLERSPTGPLMRSVNTADAVRTSGWHSQLPEHRLAEACRGSPPSRG